MNEKIKSILIKLKPGCSWQMGEVGSLTTEVYILPFITFTMRATVKHFPRMTDVETKRGIFFGWLIWAWYIRLSSPKRRKMSVKFIKKLLEISNARP